MPHRISENDSLGSAVCKLAEGSPGAVAVIAELVSISPLTLWWLDQLGIYGTHIWTLYHRACHNNITATLGLLQSVRCGLTPLAAMLAAANGTLRFTEHELKELCDVLTIHPFEET